MKSAKENGGFSLTETVVALGLFTFCVLAVISLIPVGMNSARSVAEETSAVNLAEAFFGAWLVAPSNATTFLITNMFTNPAVPLTATNGTNYFRSDGEQVSSPNGAGMEMAYNVTSNVNERSFNIDLTFKWPVTSATNAVQTRNFNQVIPR